MMIIMMNMVDRLRKYFFILIALLPITVLGQNASKGMMTFEAGGGVNAYRLQSSQGFGSSPAGSFDINGMIGYYFHKNVNFNLEYENHSYLREVNGMTEYLGANRIGVGIRYALIDRPKYQLSLGGTVGGFNFGYIVTDSLSVAEFGAKGIYQTYGLTNKFLFGESRKFGLFLKVGLVNNPMTIDKIIINDEEKEELDGIPVRDYKINSIGYYVKLGLTYHFGRRVI